MATFSRNKIQAETIATVVRSAQETLGVPMVTEERQLLSTLAGQMLELQRQVDRMDEGIRTLAQQEPETIALGPTVGWVTAAVLVAMLGSAAQYPSAGAYMKAMGLNLKEG